MSNDRLWAPWRADLFADPPPAGCIFCTLPGEPPANDEKNLIVHRGEKAFVILNKYPYTAGHLMVVPFAHADDPASLVPLAGELFSLAARSTDALRKIMRPDAFNLGMNLGKAAGAGVPGHALHWASARVSRR